MAWVQETSVNGEEQHQAHASMSPNPQSQPQSQSQSQQQALSHRSANANRSLHYDPFALPTSTYDETRGVLDSPGTPARGSRLSKGQGDPDTGINLSLRGIKTPPTKTPRSSVPLHGRTVKALELGDVCAGLDSSPRTPPRNLSSRSDGSPFATPSPKPRSSLNGQSPGASPMTPSRSADVPKVLATM
jgi:hypothetical protein